MLPAFAAAVIHHCRRMASFSETGNTAITRTFLCPAMHSCHSYLGEWMRHLGMSVSIDSAGNLRGLYGDPLAPRFLIGSHLDTVSNAGCFDGVLGVVLGLALIEAARPWLRFAIEIIGFSEEEGVRFAVPFLGSKSLIHGLDASELALRDRNGVSVARAIRDFGFVPSTTPGLNSASIGFLEFHIEQGPVLDSAGQSLAIVNSISGQSRATLTFTGKAGHAGTTPMHLRHDALAAAVEWIAAVEHWGRATPGLVATVGKLNVAPNGSNVIPGEVLATLDVRHVDNEKRREARTKLLETARSIAAQRPGITVETRNTFEQDTVLMNDRLIRMLKESFAESGAPSVEMASGAGHDAMIVAERLPSAMVFLRSPGGISHHPNENVYAADVENALRVGLSFLRRLPGSFE